MGFIRKEFWLPASGGGHDIYCCYWQEEGRTRFRGMLQLAHGMAEHILRYEEFALYFANNGFLICGNDHMGHGQSVGNQAEFGYFGEQNGVKNLVNDMYSLTVFMKKQFPGLPHCVIGHSMGSFLTRKYITQYGGELSAAIFLGTSGGHRFIDLAITLSKKGIERKGAGQKGHSVNKLAFASFNVKCRPHRTNFDWVSSDEVEVQKFIQDENCGFVFTYGGYHDLFCLLKEISRKDWAEKVPAALPILLLSGKEDPVGAYGKGVQEVYQRLLSADVQQVKMKLYANARHELLHERNRRQVYQDILHWLNQHMPIP